MCAGRVGRWGLEGAVEGPRYTGGEEGISGGVFGRLLIPLPAGFV